MLYFFSFAHKDREGNFSKVIQQKQEWIEGQGGGGGDPVLRM